ncbi:MAG: hypothetical protein PHY15_06760 [Eubacteriales bacterium]|nr:hypothetical protein [Eubacteriales bacterium]
MEKINVEIVRDFDNSYYANVVVDGNVVRSLPEYVNYRTLKTAIKEQAGYEIPTIKALSFTRMGRKQYAHLQNY